MAQLKDSLITGDLRVTGTIYGLISGNANTATKLATARKINGTNFDGTADITTTNWGTSRTVSIGSTAGTTGTSVNGSANVTLTVPSTMTGFTSITSTTFVGALTGHASSDLALTGGTLSGDLLFSNPGATATRQIRLQCADNDYGRIAVGGTASNSGYMEIATADDANEPIYVRQYSGVYTTLNTTLTLLDASHNTTIPGRLTMSGGQAINQILTGTGTAASDKGSGVSPRYFPARWTFNTGRAAVDGDIYTIKIPVAGHTHGVFMSVNNGTNYYPVVLNGTGRITTHYAVNTYLTVIFESTGSAADMYALNGADARATVSGGVFRVINFYDSNSNTIPASWCGTAAATAAKAADHSNFALKANSYTLVTMRYANSAASAITLNINGTGAKPIYINGSASSASNYTLPAGTYVVFYNGTNYYFRTDAGIQGGTWFGNASTASKLATARTISLTGSVTGSGTFDGSGNLSITTTTNHSHSYLPLAGGTMTGQIKSSKAGGNWIQGRDNACLYQTITTNNNWHPVVGFKTPSGSWTMGNVGDNENCVFSYDTDTNFSAGTNTTVQAIYFDSNGYIHANRVYNAVWNDYAEYRNYNDGETPYGRVVCENGNDSVSLSTKRLQPGAMICSDTFGTSMGEAENTIPIAVAGRVLAYPWEPREEYNFFIGQAVCSGPNGTVSIMTKDEVKEYPECVVGYISAVPKYETWGTGNVKVDGRVWIKVK